MKAPRRGGQRPPANKATPQPSSAPSLTAVTLKRVQGDEWQLVAPRCAVQRADDIDEVDKMIAAGESEIAADELRFLLEECPNFLQAHQTLGQIALEAEDYPLARGHFGHVFDLVRKLWQQESARGTLPYRIPENQPVHESGKGLAWSLHHLQNDALALQVVNQLLVWEPTDPLGMRPWLTQWAAK